MTAKEYLLQYKLLTVKVESIEKDIEALRNEREGIGLDYDGMPHGTGIADKTAMLAVELVDMESYLLDVRTELWRKRMEITETIGKVENADLNKLLQLRYIEGHTWERIAVEMDFTFRWVLTLHGRALDAVQKVLEKHKKA